MSIIWGSSFALLFLILLLLSIIQFLILKGNFRKNIPDFAIPVSSNGGEDLTVHLEAYIPVIFPGFRCIWKIALKWNEGNRSILSNTHLKRGNNLYDVQFVQLLRGVYKGFSGLIILEDLFGFTRFTVYKGDPVSLIVFPEIEKNGFKREQIVSGGEVASADYERIRSDELLEVRKYYPGDDARRINWKMYAASGQLFLRMGEEIPPPTGEITVVLNSLSDQMNKLSEATLYTDLLISTYLAFIYAFVEKGCIVNTLVPLKKESMVFDPLKPDKLLMALSEITPESPLKITVKSDFVYIISHPGSISLREFSRNKPGDMKVFIKNLPELSKRRYLHQYVFRDEIKTFLKFNEKRNYVHLIQEGEKDLIYLKQIGKGRFHGEII